MLYMDNAATTKILPEVYNEMLPYLKEYFGNPNSMYYFQAEKTKEAVAEARNNVAKLFNCLPEEIIFTSGSTESNNMVLKGLIRPLKKKGNHIIVSSIEHSSIINTVKYLENNEDIEVTYLPVNKEGLIDINDLIESIKSSTILISIMWGNNELGSINDIKKISEIAHENDIYFHTDATQVIGKVNVDLDYNSCIDFLSCSAHKFYGPKGIGILFIRKDINGFYPDIIPLLHGGEQEFGLRGGTLPVHQIVGMGKASQIALTDMEKNIKILKDSEKKLVERLKIVFGDKIIFNNLNNYRIPGVISVRFIGFNNQLFLKNASSILSASSGSACSNAKPSYVLKSCGFSDKEIRETIRFSLSAYDDYNDFIEIE
ncbi:MAG: cysteine desulfurase family protein [Bacilli bacterium]|nr:cysteine desulfurase family protein [Bacilli bacterium]